MLFEVTYLLFLATYLQSNIAYTYRINRGKGPISPPPRATNSAEHPSRTTPRLEKNLPIA